MNQEDNSNVFLKNYQESAYQINHINLYFRIEDQHVRVESTLKISRNATANPEEDLDLHGVDLELKSVHMDDKLLEPAGYHVTERNLLIKNPPAEFVLKTVCLIKPEQNTSLEGLFQTQGNLCTQCEAEGFRKITYYLDRPDIMAKFQVRIEGSKDRFPVLISNGNCLDSGELTDGFHYTVWEDPFPKPSYLFALVAGQYECLEDHFVSKSGKKINLYIYAAKEDISKCSHAMESLKLAMKWDEDKYRLECDLRDYKIVASHDFNLGAMENKGLNIFNSKLILANKDIARDENYQDILSVIGHEYFHNWTGNRVTCRDWFQLCLKEGLTVFRDQEFSEDIYSAAVKRIEDVKMLQRFQWPEDEGPFSHPPRPDQYIEINNFYTFTVYNKGAEVVRMLHTLIGAENFHKGMDLYFEKFDGMAVRQEDFVAAMASVSKQDLTQFMEWYTKPGTPTVDVQESYDAAQKKYKITLKQKIVAPEFATNHGPRLIPVTLSLLDQEGHFLPLHLEGDAKQQEIEKTIPFAEKEASFTFHNIAQKPIPSLFRNFSAAVKVTPFLSLEELNCIQNHDSDPFNVWDAGQTLYTHIIMELIEQHKNQKSLSLEPELLSSFNKIIKNQNFDPAFKALALALPSEQIIAQKMQVVDVDAIYTARNYLEEQIAILNEDVFLETYEDLKRENPHELSTPAMGKRSLKNLCLSYLHTKKSEQIEKLIIEQYQNSENMTDRDAALNLVVNSSFSQRQLLLDDFYDKWKHENLAIDRWFTLQALAPMQDPKSSLEKLTAHPSFYIEQPNRMRSVIFSFCHNNQFSFHHKSGVGYKICKDYILRLNDINKQMAALLAKAFNQWKRFDTKRQNLMRTELESLKSQGHLSSAVFEIVAKALEQ